MSGKIVTNSRELGEEWGRRHPVITLAISNLAIPDAFREANFTKATYTANDGIRKFQMVNMTQAGRDVLIMTFTGDKATAWKLEYVTRRLIADLHLK